MAKSLEIDKEIAAELKALRRPKKDRERLKLKHDFLKRWSRSLRNEKPPLRRERVIACFVRRSVVADPGFCSMHAESWRVCYRTGGKRITMPSCGLRTLCAFSRMRSEFFREKTVSNRRS